MGANYLYKTKGYKKAYVIDDAETYGIGIASAFIKEFQADGGTVLGHSSEPGTTTSYLSLLTQIAAKNPDVIYFAGLDSTGGILVRQQMLQIAALKNTRLCRWRWPSDQHLCHDDWPDRWPGLRYGCNCRPGSLASAQTFITQFKSTYGASAYGAYSASAYDCMNILIQAVKTALANGAKTPQNSSDAAGAKTFRQAVINAIQGISFDGVTGHQSFDANGDTTDKVISVYQLADVSGKPDWKFLTQQSIS